MANEVAVQYRGDLGLESLGTFWAEEGKEEVYQMLQRDAERTRPENQKLIVEVAKSRVERGSTNGSEKVGWNIGCETNLLQQTRIVDANGTAYLDKDERSYLTLSKMTQQDGPITSFTKINDHGSENMIPNNASTPRPPLANA